jgi:microsomal dipeptidase-like Zn-dependent dipeptidase
LLPLGSIDEDVADKSHKNVVVSHSRAYPLQKYEVDV